MILRKYGTAYQSVDLNFDSKALSEVGFRRNQEFSLAVSDFDAQYALMNAEELVAEVQGSVQDETEQLLLNRLEQQVKEMLSALGEGEVLVVENELGHDYPKTRNKTTNVIVEGENKLQFTYSIAPPLRIGRYKPKD